MERSWLVPALLTASLGGCASQDDVLPNTNAGGAGARGGSAGSGAAVAGNSPGGAPATGGASNTGGAPSGGASASGAGGSNAGTAGASSGQGGMSAGGGGTPSAGMAGASAGGTQAGGAGASGTSAGGANAGGANAGGAGAGGTSAGTAGSVAGASGSGGAPPGGGDPTFLIFLLIGQSNMVGQPQPQSQDLVQDPRIKVLAYDDCTNVGRQYNQWYTAYPPLHQCDAGVGPGDYFAKTLLESLPEGYTIGLVPLGVNGAPIDVFRKNVPRPGWELPPDNHWETGFEWIMSRAELAQKDGVIRGILFHQGESDSEQTEWVDKVKGLVNDLRTDLGIGAVPFLAGELYYDGCCRAHNALIEQVTDSVGNGFLISAEGLNGTDQYHFDLAAQREFGRRYATAMQGALTLP